MIFKCLAYKKAVRQRIHFHIITREWSAVTQIYFLNRIWSIDLSTYYVVFMNKFEWFLFLFARYEKKNDSKQKKVFIRNYLAWFGLSMIYFCRYDLLIDTRTIHLSTIVFQKLLIYTQRMPNVVTNERFRCVLYQCHKLFFGLTLVTL